MTADEHERGSARDPPTLYSKPEEGGVSQVMHCGGIVVLGIALLAGCGGSSPGASQPAGNNEAGPDAAGALTSQDAASDDMSPASNDSATIVDSGADSAGLPDVAGGDATCLATGGDCTSTPNACCSGICLAPANPMEHYFCADPCMTGGTACASGCCASPSNTTQMACAPRGFCTATCAGPGVACTTPYDCCVGHTCVTTNTGTCAAICTQNAQCASGCCAPLANASINVCSARQFCP